MSRMRSAIVAAGVGTLGAALWWRRNPSPCPYWQRIFVELPHPGITRARLIEALDPHPGEQIAEVGPGTGYYTLTVSPYLGSQGKLEIIDIQQQMLDHVMRNASESGITNLVATKADATALPQPDASFDAIYLTVMLGEIPDPSAALCEFQRVLKPGGRMVVGEILVEPHAVTIGKLRKDADQAGFRFDRRLGSPLAYFAAFTKPE